MKFDSSFYGAIAGVFITSSVAFLLIKQFVIYSVSHFIKRVDDLTILVAIHDKKIAIFENELYGKAKRNTSDS